MESNTKTEVLYIEEEYGYRHWIGILPADQTIRSVIEWWEALPSVMGMFFCPKGQTPFPIFELEGDEDDLFWVDDSGEKVTLQKGRHKCVGDIHIHEDMDSSLKNLETESFHYHKGYKGKPSTLVSKEEEEELLLRFKEAMTNRCRND
jgi:hypothetical protein